MKTRYQLNFFFPSRYLILREHTFFSITYYRKLTNLLTETHESVYVLRQRIRGKNWITFYIRVLLHKHTDIPGIISAYTYREIASRYHRRLSFDLVSPPAALTLPDTTVWFIIHRQRRRVRPPLVSSYLPSRVNRVYVGEFNLTIFPRDRELIPTEPSSKVDR